MSEEKESKSLKRNFKNKIIFGLCLASMVTGIAGIGLAANNYQKLQSLQDSVYELAEFSSYDLDKHQAIKTEEEIEEEATLFKQSGYFTENSIDSSITLDELWKVSDSNEYYILFYMNSCSHCKQLESDLYNNMPFLEKQEVYFLTADTLTEQQGFVWSTEAVEETELSIDKDNFELIGTPMMVKVQKNSDKINVYLGGDSILSELNLE